MNRLEGLGFLCLTGCTVAIALSQPVVGAILGILAGGPFAASVRPRPMGFPPTPPRDDDQTMETMVPATKSREGCR